MPPALDMAAWRTPCNAARLADRDGASPRAARSRNDCAMIDFAAARRMMVDGQVRTSDVTDPRIIAAMLELPRERFVPEASAALAYLDLDLPVTEEPAPGARRLLKPMVLAKLVQAADIGRDARVLDVACGTGYSSALLARLARSVVALEDDAALAQRAPREPRVARLRQCRGGDWPAAGRLARRRALRRHPAQRRRRSRARTSATPVARRADGWSAWRDGRRPARRCSTFRPAGRRAACRSSTLRRRSCPPLQRRRPSYSDTGQGPLSTADCGAENASVPLSAQFVPVAIPQGFHRGGKPLMVDARSC